MKNFIIISTLLIVAVILIPSCDDDFLDRYPLDALSEEIFFGNAADLKTYVNSLYDQMPQYHFQWGVGGMANWRDLNADVQIVSRSITGSLDQRGSDNIAPLTSGSWNSSLSQIRRTNFFLVNYHKVDSRDPVTNQFIGEGYFFRAYQYFNFLVEFGDVPILLKPLNLGDKDDLYKPRDSRYDVAKQIINDLDSAIVNLQWKGRGEAVAGRINKEAAIVLKARVALFEGTWQYYHSAKGTPFAVQGRNGTEFLELIFPAVQELIDHQGANIFRNGGPLNEPYNQLFAVENGHAAPGVFWYRHYNTVLLSHSHNFYDKVNDSGRSITRRLTDMYLDNDGVPQAVSLKPLTTLNEMGQNLDPRFRQTIWTPDRGPMSQIPGRGIHHDQNLRYPLITTGLEDFTSTGFRMWKGAVLDKDQWRAGEQDDILIRYAEGLLAYAEAKAILGAITQDDIDKTINVLRSRVGMAPMVLSEVNSWNITYNESDGFDPSASNIINEIRRERTVELALEGFRLNDLKRWAVFESAINGYLPRGAQLQEFLDYFNNEDALAADGWGFAVNLTLTPGENCAAFSDGSINPLYNSTQFQEGGDGFWIDKDRHYLSPVPKSEILLFEANGVTLTQNPGWN